MAHDRRTASRVVAEHIETLNLASFPCGKGPWVRTNLIWALLPWRPSWAFAFAQRNEKLSDYSLQGGADVQATVDELQDYAHAEKSPWKIDSSWSGEARALRDVAIRFPHKLKDPDYVRKFFRTLKLINEKIDDVDPELVAYENLTELSLSCNCLNTIAGRNLPRQLEVLELCGNQLLEPWDLCPDSPSGMRHVGLGYNCLRNLNWLLPAWWSKVLSLDVSFNCLASLPEVLSVLLSLPKLRNLVLQGNPLSLVPAYRLYVIKKLPCLSALDDVRIIPDHRQACEKLGGSLNEDDLSKVRFDVSIEQLRGIPPPNDDSPDPTKEKIEYRYYVEYDYVPLESESEETQASTVFRTQELTWSDPLIFNYSFNHFNSQLEQCCRLFLTGIRLRIVRARTVSIAPSDSDTPTNNKSSKPDKAPKGSESKRRASKKTPPTSATRSKDKGAAEKEKKGSKTKAGKNALEVDEDWIKQPPQLKYLAEETISLKSLLSGHGSNVIKISSELTLKEGQGPTDDENQDQITNSTYITATFHLQRHPVALKLQ